MTETTVATASATWQEPDLDTLWSDSGVLDEDGTSASSDLTDVALVALDY